jgi:hypothetical protein
MQSKTTPLETKTSDFDPEAPFVSEGLFYTSFVAYIRGEKPKHRRLEDVLDDFRRRGILPTKSVRP